MDHARTANILCVKACGKVTLSTIHYEAFEQILKDIVNKHHDFLLLFVLSEYITKKNIIKYFFRHCHEN